MARIEGDYLVITENIVEKKIAGHAFVDILGANPYSQVGDALLKFHKVITETVDEKWLKRGDFAEKIVQHVYSRDGEKIKVYDKRTIKYDNFPENKNFGGLIDIELPEKESLIEVKSKSLKDYENILRTPPKHEVLQGMLYAKLRNYTHFTMEWIFFDAQTEKEIFEGCKPTTLANLKRITKHFQVNDEYITAAMQNVLALVEDFRATKKIPLSKVSDEVLDKLNLIRPSEFGYEDLPF